MLPQTLGNAEDGVPSAFPQGKQNEKISFVDIDNIKDNYSKILPSLFHFVYDQLG